MMDFIYFNKPLYVCHLSYLLYICPNTGITETLLSSQTLLQVHLTLLTPMLTHLTWLAWSRKQQYCYGNQEQETTPDYINTFWLSFIHKWGCNHNLSKPENVFPDNRLIHCSNHIHYFLPSRTGFDQMMITWITITIIQFMFIVWINNNWTYHQCNSSTVITSVTFIFSHMKQIIKYKVLMCTMCILTLKQNIYIDGLIQERHNSFANALELCLSCPDPLHYHVNRFL